MPKKFAPLFFLIATLAVAIALHSYNMLGYPYFESDEGTYTSQAWALATSGDLAPYTYWYDHPPFGWIVLALWTTIFKGGFFAFGSSIETGRVFMLVIHAASASLIYYIVLQATKRSLPAFAATLLFSLSPLAIYFQRRILLDNIMVFWILAALAIAYVPYKKIQLRNYIFSGAFFALAVLTKVTAVMFGPAFLFLLLVKESPVTRYFRTTVWFVISGMIVSVYLLYALLRSEFFPAKTGEPDHVSFLDALAFQSGRKGGNFLDPTSDFRVTLGDWIIKDAFFIYAAEIALLIPVALALLGFVFWLVRYSNVKFSPGRNLWVFLLCMIMYFLFLIRGGVTFNFYIVPIIPFVGLSIAIFVHNLLELMPRPFYNAVFGLMIAGIAGYYGFLGPHNHFTANETQNQKNAVIWVKENVDNDAAMLIDSYAYVDLHDPRYINGKEFPNADWYYKISRDPEIGEAKYNLNWRNFDYIGLTHEMMRQIREGDDPIVRTAFDNALPEKKWTADMTAFVDEQKLLSTNGDWAMIYRVNDSSRAVLVDSWRTYKQRFITLQGEQYGKVTNLETDTTTSQGQSLAMLRAVSMYDREMFNAVWGWSRDHLQSRSQDKLFSREWKDDSVSASDNAADADLDAALALVFAYRIWNDETYLSAAQEIMEDVWRQNVVTIDDTHYLIALNKKSALSGPNQDEYLMNPSYFSPAWYRVFAEVDETHEWDKLADDSYAVLDKVSDVTWNNTDLPMNWVALNVTTGRISSAATYVSNDVAANQFGDEAFRTLWRVSVDAAWFESEQAVTYLGRINSFLTPFVLEDGLIPIAISASGVQTKGESLSHQAAYLSALMWGEDTALAGAYYERTLEAVYDAEQQQWGDGTNYTDANWAWFGSAIYNRKFINLWETSLE